MPNTAPEARRKYLRRTLWLKQLIQGRKTQETMNLNRAVAQAQVTLFEDKVRVVLDREMIPADMRHQYMAYALALDKSQRLLVWMVDLIREHQILRDRFGRRGLQAPVLDALDQLIIYRVGVI